MLQQKAAAFPYEVVEETLDNGLRIFVVPMPAGGLASYWSIVRTGSRDEVEPGVTGFAHFFEHVMFKGTEKMPGSEYDRIVNGLGADGNAYTTDDYTAYHLGFAAEDLETVAEIESERFQNLSYSELEFRTEAGAVYGEYRKNRASPFGVLFEALQDAAFDVHTYKHTTIGFEADIAAMPEKYEYSKGFFKRFYRPENVVLVVAGDVDPEATVELLRDKYDGWERGYEAPKVPVEPFQTKQRRIDVPFDGQTLPILAVTFKGDRLKPKDPVMMAATLMGELAFGATSDLYKKLVLDEQRLQALFEDFGFTRDPSLWGAFAMVKDPSDVASIEGEIWGAVRQLQTELVSQEQLDNVRSSLKYGFLSSLSTPDEVCSNLARVIALTGDLLAVNEIYATLDQVTPAHVMAAANLYLHEDSSTVAVLHAADQPLPEVTAGAQAPVLMPVPEDPNVAFQVWFQVGTQNDPLFKEGLASLTAQLIGEGGTASRAYDEILAELFPMAGNYWVTVDKEMTVVRGEVHRDRVLEFYELFSDALLQPGFRTEDFERLRQDSINGIEKSLRYSSDEELGKAVLYDSIFQGTRYAGLNAGSVDSLKALTIEDVRAFWEANYTKDNMVIGLGGAYPDSLLARIQADFQRLPAGKPEPVPAPNPLTHSGRQVMIAKKPGPSTAISFGFPIDVHRGEREFYALWLASSWLGEHRNQVGRLFQKIREVRGMNYGNYSYIEAFPNGGSRQMPPTGVGRRSQIFEVWVRPVPEENAIFALRAALHEVDLLAKNGLTREQFEFHRNFLKKYSLQFATTTGERLGYAMDDRFYGLEESHLARCRRMMDSLTYEEVQAVIKKHVQADNLHIALVTEHAEAMRDALVSDAPTPLDYGDLEKSQAVLDEDKQIEKFPLKISAERVSIVPVDELFVKSIRGRW